MKARPRSEVSPDVRIAMKARPRSEVSPDVRIAMKARYLSSHQTVLKQYQFWPSVFRAGDMIR